jgi:hypothetical protein
MADKVGNTVLGLKRLELQRHEQLLTVRRLELRLMEMDDEKTKIDAQICSTKDSILEIEKTLSDAGIKF